MEAYVVAAGQMDSINRWQQDLNAQFLPVYKNGKPTGQARRLLVAPIQLFKIVFPKEEKENVMSMICPEEYMFKRQKLLGYGTAAIRKALKLKKIPLPVIRNPLLQPNLVDKAVAVMPIGTKEDITNSDGEEQI